MLTLTKAWRQAYPGALVGVLAIHGVANPRTHAGLDRRKEAVEADLRARFGELDRPALRALPVMAAYAGYYRRFGKTYHVQQQIESIAWKGKSVPGVAALVEAMFLAELQNGLLTAGHDLAAVEPPVRIDVADGSEVYRCLNGKEQVLKEGDMYIADARGVLSSILYGPDERTQIRPGTERVLFTVYVPAGIDTSAVRRHLEDIRDHVRIVAPQAEVVALDVLGA
ncbi:MAG: phenylalanine--tRNA ligase beta subunit-related protein [Anaerolineae bacterium]